MKISSVRISYDAMLAALCAVLGCFSFDTGNLKLSIENLPVVFGVFCFGTPDGFLIAITGSFISQLIMYGLSATTIIWMLPLISAAAFAGIFRKKTSDFSGNKIAVPVIASELALLLCNTAALYADSRIYGYYSAVYVFGSIPWRFFISALRSFVYILILPPLLRAVRKVV